MRKALAGSLLVHALVGALLFASVWKGFQRRRLVVGLDSIQVAEALGESRTQPPARKTGHMREQALASKIPAATSETPAAVKAGSETSASASGAIQSYLAGVRAKLGGEIHAPRASGPGLLRAVLKLTLESSGEVKSSSIGLSSGDPAFDRSILEALQRARPFPPFPAKMGGVHEVTLQLPIEIRSAR